jgi:hypothetical protein
MRVKWPQHGTTLMDRIYVRQAIEAGIKDSDAGETLDVQRISQDGIHLGRKLKPQKPGPKGKTKRMSPELPKFVLPPEFRISRELPELNKIIFVYKLTGYIYLNKIS